MRIAQISFSRSGGFCPTSLPLFQVPAASRLECGDPCEAPLSIERNPNCGHPKRAVTDPYRTLAPREDHERAAGGRVFLSVYATSRTRSHDRPRRVSDRGRGSSGGLIVLSDCPIVLSYPFGANWSRELTGKRITELSAAYRERTGTTRLHVERSCCQHLLSEQLPNRG